MATKKTAIFTLTERLTLDTNGATTTATIDLGSYVDVGDRQALQVHSVDFIFQGTTPVTGLVNVFSANSNTIVQVTDLNRGGIVFSDDRALVASGVLSFGNTENAFTIATDLYPDNYGKGADDGRYIVNDALYISAITGQLVADEAVNVTVRVNASIVTLSQKDFMAIAIQSTAADN